MGCAGTAETTGRIFCPRIAESLLRADNPRGADPRPRSLYYGPVCAIDSWVDQTRRVLPMMAGIGVTGLRRHLNVATSVRPLFQEFGIHSQANYPETKLIKINAEERPELLPFRRLVITTRSLSSCPFASEKDERARPTRSHHSGDSRLDRDNALARGHQQSASKQMLRARERQDELLQSGTTSECRQPVLLRTRYQCCLFAISPSIDWICRVARPTGGRCRLALGQRFVPITSDGRQYSSRLYSMPCRSIHRDKIPS